MVSAELYQALGRNRHEELLREASTLLMSREAQGAGLFARLATLLRTRRGAPKRAWVQGGALGRPAHG